MKIFNDDYLDNLFSLAIKRNNPRIVLEMMKNLSQMPQELLVNIYGEISLKDVIKKHNAHTEPLIKNAMIPVLSDRNVPPPVVFQ